MEPVRHVVGRGVHLRRSDVDTDQIIPSDWLKRVERTGYGEGLFSEWRESSDFVLNLERHRGANILVAGPNFGCGSSREHAGWALQDYGFEAIVAAGFGDIFANNCAKLGLLTVVVDQEIVEQVWDAIEDDPDLEIVIDVEQRRFAVPSLGIDVEFPLDDHTHYRLLGGHDDVGLTLQHLDEIEGFEARRPDYLPTTT